MATTLINSETLTDKIKSLLNDEIGKLAEEAAEKAAAEYKTRYKKLFINAASAIIEQHYRVEYARDEMVIRIDIRQEK